MKTMYAVVEQYFEYNDEFYYPLGGESAGRPVQLFADRNAAYYAARQANICELAKTDLSGYCQSVDELIPCSTDVVTWWHRMRDIRGPSARLCENVRDVQEADLCALTAGASREQLEQILDTLLIEFFYVIPVPVSEANLDELKQQLSAKPASSSFATATSGKLVDQPGTTIQG